MIVATGFFPCAGRDVLIFRCAQQRGEGRTVTEIQVVSGFPHPRDPHDKDDYRLWWLGYCHISALEPPQGMTLEMNYLGNFLGVRGRGSDDRKLADLLRNWQEKHPLWCDSRQALATLKADRESKEKLFPLSHVALLPHYGAMQALIECSLNHNKPLKANQFCRDWLRLVSRRLDAFIWDRTVEWRRACEPLLALA